MAFPMVFMPNASSEAIVPLANERPVDGIAQSASIGRVFGLPQSYQDIPWIGSYLLNHVTDTAVTLAPPPSPRLSTPGSDAGTPSASGSADVYKSRFDTPLQIPSNLIKIADPPASKTLEWQPRAFTPGRVEIVDFKTSLNGFLELFAAVRTDSAIKPLTDRVRVDLARPVRVVLPCGASDYGRIYLIAVHYEKVPQLHAVASDDRAFVPTAVFFQDMRPLKDQGREVPLAMVARAYVAGHPLLSYVSGKSSATAATLTLRSRFVIGAAGASEGPTASFGYTAVDPMFPSPLLTVSNLVVDLGASPEDECVALGVSTRRIQPGRRSESSLNAYVRPGAANRTEVGFTSSIRLERSDGRRLACFPEPLHFVLDAAFQDDVAIQFTIWKSRGGQKYKQAGILRTVVPGPDWHEVVEGPDVTISFDGLFPAAAVPPADLRESLRKASAAPPFASKMLAGVLPYIVEQRVRLLGQPAGADFGALVELFRCAGERNDCLRVMQVWIEHYFTPTAPFCQTLAELITADVARVHPAAYLVFRLLFKAIAAEAGDDRRALLDALFAAIADAPALPCLDAACDLIAQLLHVRKPPFVHAIAHRFLRRLGATPRLIAFQTLFSDPAFLSSLARPPIEPSATAPYPYIPIFSLFYHTVYSVFARIGSPDEEESKSQHAEVFKTLSILADALESHPETVPLHLPLFEIVLTFYGALEIEEQQRLTIIIFVLMRVRAVPMFYGEWRADVRWRLFTVLASLVRAANIRAAPVRPGLSLADFTEQVVCRTLRLLESFSGEITAGELESVFGLLGDLVRLSLELAPKCGHWAFHGLAHFIALFRKQVFVEQTTFIFQAVVNAVDCAHVNGPGQIEAVGFLLWLIDQEALVRKPATRCLLAGQSAVAAAVMRGDKFVPFWEKLPADFAALGELQRKLERAKSPAWREVQIRELLRLSGEFKALPSVRAAIADYIAKGSESEHSARRGVAYWQLSALIAEVLTLRKERLAGASSSGIVEFPFGETTIDLSSHPPDSAYLALHAPLFTEERLAVDLESAMTQFNKLGLHWAVTRTPSYLLRYVDATRNAGRLEKLYRALGDAYREMAIPNAKDIGFARVVMRGKGPENLQMRDIIISVDDRNELPNCVNNFCKKVFDKERFTAPQETQDGTPTFARTIACAYVRVKAQRSQVVTLSASKFHVLVWVKDEGWNAPILQRHEFETEWPLPSSAVAAAVTKVEKKEILKAEYFEAKLGKLAENLRTAYKDVKDLGQPLIERKNPTREVPTARLIGLIGKIGSASRSRIVLAFLKEALFSEIVAVPPPILEKTEQIRKLLRKSICLLAKVSRIITLSPLDVDVIRFFGDKWNLSLNLSRGRSQSDAQTTTR